MRIGIAIRSVTELGRSPRSGRESMLAPLDYHKRRGGDAIGAHTMWPKLAGVPRQDLAAAPCPGWAQPFPPDPHGATSLLAATARTEVPRIFRPPSAALVRRRLGSRCVRLRRRRRNRDF